jgi:Clr5 domain
MDVQAPMILFSLQQDFAPSQFMEEDFNDIPMLRDQGPWHSVDLAYRSHEPSVVAPEPPKHPTAQDWDNIKPVFTKLYSVENRALKEVKNVLERDYGFVAT